MFLHLPLLSLLIWLPIVGAIFVLATGSDKNSDKARIIAIITALICLLLSIPLFINFDTSTYLMQFTEHKLWINAFNINYDLGVDGISMPMIVLTNFTGFIVILAAMQAIRHKVAQYLAAFLILQGMMVGVFAALDSILFYVFWEGMLIPMYICIGVWGGENRSYASIKFFIYTFLGSALMLVAILYLHMQSDSFAISSFYQLHLPLTVQVLLFIALFLSFAVKMPMWPLHTWLPDAHTEAPAGGSVVLAALMLKMGGYGFLRFSLPMLPDACARLDWVMIVLSLIAIVYVAFITIVQTDIKRLIAYSSISHMGFVTLGCFLIYEIMNQTGNRPDAYMSLEGAMVQMIAHAFSSGAMFLGVGFLYDRLHTRLISNYGGVASKMPVFAAFFMLFAMSNVGLPGTAGFVGEFMVILSAFRAHFWVAFLAATPLVLGAAYTLWMYKRVFFGEVVYASVKTLKDLNALEITVYILLAIGVLAIGLYPEWLLNVMHATVDHILQLALQT